MAERIIAVDDQTGKKRLIALPSGGGIDPDVQSFTADGTWTKPADCKQVRVILIGGGGGGGSGMYGTSGEQCGGGGGAGGELFVQELVASDLSATVSVTVGQGGSGGASVSTNNYNGKDGANGGDTLFGSHAKAQGGLGGKGGARYKIGRIDFLTGLAGNLSAGKASLAIAEDAISTIYAPASGGAGGSISASEQGGGLGGTVSIGPGGNGGSGGYSRSSNTGDSGVDGSANGGGGGGGGASKGSASGAGGSGARGICIVIAY